MDYLALRQQSIVVANDIIQKGRFNLSAKGLKILFYLLAQITPQDTELRECEIDLANFCKFCGVSIGGMQRSELEDNLERLEYPWKVRYSDNRSVSLAWSRGFELDPNTNKLIVTLDQRLKPYLLQLRANFTQSEIIYLLSFKSKYAIRLYLLVKSIHYKELESYTREIPIDQLKQSIGAESYTAFRDFHSRAIKPAVAEINQCSDKILSYELVKNGRSVVAIKFTIETKDAMDRLKLVDQIEKRLGTEQISIFDQLEEHKDS